MGNSVFFLGFAKTLQEDQLRQRILNLGWAIYLGTYSLPA